MTNKQHQKIEKLINQLIIELTESIIYLKGESQPVEPSVALGRLTRMEAINDKSVAEAMLAKSERRLDRLNNALTRIDKESFGTCVHCNKEISYGRMQAIPESLVCVPCLEKQK